MFPYPASERKKGSWLKFHLVFPAALTIFSFAFGVFIKPMFTFAKISNYVAYVVLFGEFFIFLLGTYGAYFNMKDQKKFFDVLDCIDKEFFSKFSTTISYIKLLKKSLFKFSMIFIILLSSKIFVRYASEYNLRYYTYLFIPSLFSQLKCFQITFYLNIMHEKLKLLLDKLQEKSENSCYFISLEINTRRRIGKILLSENFNDLKRIYGKDFFIPI
jgi:hypothetical protein